MRRRERLQHERLAWTTSPEFQALVNDRFPILRAKRGGFYIDGHAMDADPFFALAHQIQDRLLAERQACAKVNSEGPA